ncbi:MAG: hypothetical protein A3C84_00520 [Candidatus Ryanbacteria bacterium RIFCSPHIGHO2_02_FULL_48_12]|jgi:hypothetical protein|uniref:DUF4446 domain-containing protein n=1 Tax=Candidatus Ryanbacteria bacterium RIFCSPHIGHO2_01_FULL_48_27 TaxID=1802115 RepID=A0A1G2FZZ1_9BACT|nr:MAG: hypothetical protein A2756_04900 [Candidatus Ryanbacteria bacterium RIFCSPHIGHO2_01_FULL_48_27]OGZ50253.1 MAG: hypothetical protein A3C84_00520 [Candidatus Ryanbacteria bacterium RIFCSPHIGHO2_02_FULL_48_12]
MILGNPVVIGVFGLIFVLLALGVWWLVRIERRTKAFFLGKNARDLEDVMVLLKDEISDTRESLQVLEAHLKSIDVRLARSIQYMGMVRFNPFKDAGGDQSFAFALLDEAHNGMVISSLYSREGVRIYAKPIQGGKSTYSLSAEETEAMRRALGGRPENT